MRYRVFTRDNRGDLNYAATSESFGWGEREIALIVDGHQMSADDVIYINDYWIRIVKKSESTNPADRPWDVVYEFLPVHEDPDFLVGGEPWSLQTINRLYGQAVAMESMK